MPDFSKHIALRISTSVLLAAVVVFSGCNKTDTAGAGPAETAGKQLDKAAAEAGKELKQAAEKTGQVIERAGEKMQEKAKEAQK